MYLRLSIQGNLPAGEVWSCNPAFHFNAIFSPVWDQASGDAIVQALLTALTSSTIDSRLLTLISGGGSITGYRLEGRDEDESLLGVSEGVYATPVFGIGTMTKPVQTAMVASLRTQTPGSRGRGRMYWPALGCTISSTTGRVTTPSTADAATAFRSFLSLIESTIQANAGVFPWTDVLLAVRSPTDHVSRTVTRIQVGDVADVQRRRRDTLPENYSSLSYPA